MDWTEAEGGTFEEAVASLLNALGADRSEVEIDHMGAKSKFFGFGKTVVKVRGRLKKEAFDEGPPKKRAPAQAPVKKEPLGEADEKCREYLEEIVKGIGIERAVVTATKTNGTLTLDIVSDSGGLIIGRKGETLESMQMLVEIYANRINTEKADIVVDTENYRSRRREKLVDMARKSARQAVKRGRKVRLGPMKASERKIIHSCLHNNPKVETKSEGEGNRREVVVFPLK